MHYSLYLTPRHINLIYLIKTVRFKITELTTDFFIAESYKKKLWKPCGEKKKNCDSLEHNKIIYKYE